MSPTTASTHFCFFSVLWVMATGLVPTSAVPLDAYSPQILAPQLGDTWVVGENRTVIWNVSDAPAQITNHKGKIWLRKDDKILFNYTLARGFCILDGHIDIVVPDVSPSDDYSVVLYGTGGNWSPPFIILPQDSDTPAPETTNSGSGDDNEAEIPASDDDQGDREGNDVGNGAEKEGGKANEELLGLVSQKIKSGRDSRSSQDGRKGNWL